MTVRPIIKALGPALAVLVGLSAASPAFADPYDYRDRRDAITSSAGEANAANIATHMVNPWPPYVRDSRIGVDGRRAGLGITRYQLNQSIPPKGLENAPVQAGGSGASMSK